MDMVEILEIIVQEIKFKLCIYLSIFINNSKVFVLEQYKWLLIFLSVRKYWVNKLLKSFQTFNIIHESILQYIESKTQLQPNPVFDIPAIAKKLHITSNPA